MIVAVDDPAEITALYLADERPAFPHRPWVTMGMIASLDGSVVVDGGSTALGGPPDRAVFRALRAVADVVLVGATTLRAESYRAPRLGDDLVEWRAARGMPPAPRVAIVSNSLDLDPTPSLAESRPIVITSRAADPERLRAVSAFAEVVVCGEARVDPSEAVQALRERGAERVILEGGPHLNGAMLDLIDEASVTISPMVAGGDGPRMVVGGLGGRSVLVDRVIVADGFLLVRGLLR